MSDKKKTSVGKSADKQVNEGSKTSKASEPARRPATSRSGVSAAPQQSDGPRQLAAFEAAMRLFHARNLREARELFARATEGPERDIANRARLHLAMCDRRLDQSTVTLRTAEDYYNYGVALINSRNLTGAREHLATALRMAPGADHVHYALSVAQALAGDLASAIENMKRAIEIEPRNRIIARQDADLAQLANQPPFDALLYPEKKAW